MKSIKNFLVFTFLIISLLVIPVNSMAATHTSSSGTTHGGADLSEPTTESGVQTNPIINPLENPESYKPSGSGSELIEQKKTSIISIGASVGVVVSVIAVIVLGIKYIVGSVEQRSDYKKTMVPMAIGMILIALISTIIKILTDVSGSAFG